MNIKSIDLKIGKMRKAQEFVIYPKSSVDKSIVFQSDKCTGKIDIATRKVFFTNKGCYSYHLAFAEEIVMPEEMINQIVDLYNSQETDKLQFIM